VALQSDQLIIGWADAEGLLEPTLDWEHFREIVSDANYSKEPNLRRAAAAAGPPMRIAGRRLDTFAPAMSPERFKDIWRN
jgi:hypothetical protein